MSMFPLATVTTTANQSAVTFSNIPQTFTHLQLRAYFRSHNSGAIWSSFYINPNGDGTASNFYSHRFSSDGTSFTAAANASSTIASIFSGAGSTANANVYGQCVVEILDYTNTNKWKTIRGVGGFDNNGSGYVSFTSELWKSSSAITSLLFGPDGTFAVGSTISLYGIATSNATGA